MSDTSTRELPLPTFLIIGAQKSATRWLRFNLGLHADVFVAPAEVQFFNNNKRWKSLGEDWYRAQFEGWNGEPIVGESTPSYMFYRHTPQVVAERIKSVVPDARLIALLRNPIERARSAVTHHIARKRLTPDADILELVRSAPPERERFGLVSGGWYATSLEPYVEVFGDQLLVLLHDEIATDPKALYERALRHIGADPTFVPDELDRVRFSNTEKRAVKVNGKQPLTLEQRRELYEYFADDIFRLEKLLERDLSLWYPKRSS